MSRITFFTILLTLIFHSCKTNPDSAKIGSSQEICYGSVPEPLQKIIASSSLEEELTIAINSNPHSEVPSTNKAVVLVNSASSRFILFEDYVKPYLDNFGIPYETFDTDSIDRFPPFNKYGLIIFGHDSVFHKQYPIESIQSAVSSGSGLVSFDPFFFSRSSLFVSVNNAPETVFSKQIRINNTDHYITEFHATDEFSPANNVINLLSPLSVVEMSNLINGIPLAELDSSGVSLLQIAEFGNGKIVHWNSTDWMLDSILGPVFGMDDLLWKGMVWAARKPFVLKGMPPFITMRVDDVQGRSDRILRNFLLRTPGNKLLKNFEWINICNKYGIIPWCGTFNDEIPNRYIPTLKYFLDNDLATASPHAFSGDVFIYFNHFGESGFDPAQNVVKAKEFYEVNGLKISNLIFPHFYEISPDALEEVKKMEIEFIGTHMDVGNPYMSEWINCGPYRIDRDGNSRDGRPVYYADYVHWNGYSFFNCLTEIRDDSRYKFEWYPTNDFQETSARGIRHIRRAISSMVLPTLYTHEYEMRITTENWDRIMKIITENIAEYDPEYVSMDFALEYVRARTNLTINDVFVKDSLIHITYSGKNDMDTRCVLFSEDNEQISSEYIILPQINNLSRSIYVKMN